MNVAAAGMVVIALLETEGLQAGPDLRSLFTAYRNYQGGAKLTSLMTDENMQAAERVLTALTSVVRDKNLKADLVALVGSLT